MQAQLHTRPETSFTRWVVDDEADHKALNSELLSQYKDQYGQTLAQMSRFDATLVVFLRHLGCTFCRETVHDIFHQRKLIEADGAKIAFVHMAEEDVAQSFFESFNVEDIPRFSDPSKKLYQGFGLKRGGLRALFGLKVIKRGFEAVKKGFGGPKIMGDVSQMPGVFLIRSLKILQAFKHQYASDRPNYIRIARS